MQVLYCFLCGVEADYFLCLELLTLRHTNRKLCKACRIFLCTILPCELTQAQQQGGEKITLHGKMPSRRQFLSPFFSIIGAVYIACNAKNVF